MTKPLMRYRPQADQFAGSLIGQCLGDALGFPVEGRSPEVCQRYVEMELDPENPAPRGRPPFLFGQYTDDSQLARELISSLVERGRFDPANYADRIAMLFADDLVVGRGRATTEAAARLAGGVHWRESGTPAPSAGNGSAMRAAPIGLFFWNDPWGRVEAAGDQGRITHADPRCSAGAAAIAGATARALRPGLIDPDEFLETLAPEVAEWDPTFGSYLARLREWLELSPGNAVPLIAATGMDADQAEGWNGISPFVVSSVLWSLYAFLRSPDSYWDAIRTAIGVGGDVDTTAAMTGAISGARLGLHALPQALAYRLNDRGKWPFQRLVSLAHQLHGIATEA